jgi:tRNA A-37 threonylcarbamoyl transferase component Bud32
VCGSKIEQGPMSDTQAQPLVDPFLGQMIGGRYKIVRLLGEGGMGAVYVGEQAIGGTVRKVAIKTLHTHLSKDPKIQARFERECEVVAGLQHPNTIALYDFGKTDDGTLYMVMEFVQGRSLAGVLEEKHSLEPARVTHIIQQVCDALGEAHGLGIIHRDLKPDNIVLTERAKDWVKLLDFGIAKRTEDRNSKDEQKLTQQGTVLGTPPYMSPEQFTGRPIDLRSDMYSVGVMTYEMLAGHLPFSATTPWEWATQHINVPPMPLTVTPSGQPIHPAMIGAVMKALEKEPQNRFASVKAFFEAFSSGATAPVSGASTPAPSGQKGRTEIGTPIEMPGVAPAAAYGAPSSPSHGTAPGVAGYAPPSPPGGYGPPPTPGAYGAPAPMQPQYTPAAGNVAFPTPVGIAQQPPRKQGGGKTGVVVLLLCLMVVFGGVLGYGALHHAGSGNGGTTQAADAGEAPPIVETAEPPEAEAPAPDAPLAPLTTGKAPPLPHRDAGARPGVNPPGKPPTPPPGPRPPTPPGPRPPTPPVALPPGALNGQACAIVQQWKNMGRDRDPSQRAVYNALILKCNAIRKNEEE